MTTQGENSLARGVGCAGKCPLNGTVANTVRFATGCCAMAILAAAGILKLLDLRAFQFALQDWHIIPKALSPAVSVVVPSLELIVAGSWLVGGRRLQCRIAALVLLICWTAAYCAEAFLYGPPPCNCLGSVLAYHELKMEAPILISRNVGLLAMLLVATDQSGARKQAKQASSQPTPQATSRPTGFTLLELLLVVVFVGLLLTMLMPSLSRIRGMGRSVQALSDLRSHGAIAAAYGVDFKDSFPCVLDPAYTHTLLRVGGEQWLMPYFDVRAGWWFGLADSYYGGQMWHPSFFSKRPNGGRAPYWYTLSGVATPEFWNHETRKPLGQFAAMAQPNVLYPSRKGIYVNWAGAGIPSVAADSYMFRDFRVEIGFCDGSARAIKSTTFVQPINDGEGPLGWPYTRMYLGRPVIHTVNGIRGVDVP